MKTQFLILMLSLLLFSCGKSDEPVEMETEGLGAAGPDYYPSTDQAYNTVPAIHQYSGTPSTNYTGCGSTYFGNTIQLQAYNIVSNKITFTINKTAGVFNDFTDVYIKIGNACGEVIESYPNVGPGWAFFNFSVFFTATTDVNVVAVVITPTGKYYTNPVLIKPLGIAPQDISVFGTDLGALNGVKIYSNYKSSYISGQRNYISTSPSISGIKWQCVEFVIRYYWEAYRKDIFNGINANGRGGDAKAYYAKAADKGLRRFANGGTEPPKVDDILVFDKGPSGVGHIAIITEVHSNYILIAHQNAGPMPHVNMRLARTGNSIDAKKIHDSLVTLGWLRI